MRPPHTPTRTLTAPSSHTHTYTYCAPTRLAVAARLQDCQRAGRRPRCVLPARRAHHGVRAVASKVGSSVASRERVETRRATLLPTRYTTSYQVRAAAAVGPSRRPPCHVCHHALPPAAHPAGQCEEEDEDEDEDEGLAPRRQCPLARRPTGGLLKRSPHLTHSSLNRAARVGGCPCGGLWARCVKLAPGTA